MASPSSYRKNSNTELQILINSKEMSVSKEEFLDLLSKKSNLDVYSMIRIHNEEFKFVPSAENSIFTHFNYHTSNHKEGKIYAIVNIIKAGKYTKKLEVPPLLDVSQVHLFECISCQESVPYNALQLENFTHSMNHIKTPKELYEIIKKRYMNVISDIREEELYERGVSITTLKYIKSINL